MVINTSKFRAPAEKWKKQRHEKKHICLHYTAGYTATRAYTAMDQKGGFTAFIVDTNGEIYQLFDPAGWDTHIYRHKPGENPAFYQHEKESIGIEIVNLGWVYPSKNKPNQLLTYTDKPYCTLDEREKYVVTTPYKKHSYWTVFSQRQYDSVEWLVGVLSKEFMIPLHTAMPGDRIEKWDTDVLTGWRGITTHVNYRSDKYDIGAGFNWETIGLSGSAKYLRVPYGS